MSLENPNQGIPELNVENTKRLESLMADDYNGMEMEDYLSYFNPEQVKIEIDGLEQKLTRGNSSRGEILKGFKQHLAYLAS